MSEKNKKIEKRGRKRGKYYIENDDLVSAVRHFYKTGEATTELGNYIIKIVDGVAHIPSIINYFKEDNPWGKEMRSDALFRIWKSISDRGCKIIAEEDLNKPEYKLVKTPVYIKDLMGRDIVDKHGSKVQKLNTNGKKMYNEHTEPVYVTDKKTKQLILDDDGNKIHQLVTQSNLFGYFSTIAWRACIGRIKVEKNNQMIEESYKNKVFEEFGEDFHIVFGTETENTDNDSY